MIYIPACEMRINFLMTDECKTSLEKRKINEIQNHKKTQKYFIFSESHEGHYRTALNIFLDNKFFGVGVKMFRIKCSDPKYYYKYGCTTHPHNIVMQILAETGLIGFSFLIIAITYVYIKAFKIGVLILRDEIKSSHIIQFLLLVMMAQSLIFFLPSGQFFNNWNAVIIYFPLGIYLKYVYKN
jgi:O-antigen ligase